jgi:hypothetical protein
MPSFMKLGPRVVELSFRNQDGRVDGDHYHSSMEVVGANKPITNDKEFDLKDCANAQKVCT